MTTVQEAMEFAAERADARLSFLKAAAAKIPPAYGGPVGPMPNVLGAVGDWVCWSLRTTWADLPPGVYCRDGESVWLVPGTYAGD